MPNMINIRALENSPLESHPYAHMIVPTIIPQAYQDILGAEFPQIGKPGSFPINILKFGSSFQKMLDELMGHEFEKVVSEKFGLDLKNYERMITCRGYCSGEKDGKVHTDSKTKVISVLLYLNENWYNPSGRLRLLNSPRLEDYAREISPDFGTMLLFRRCDYSFHGHLPFEGKRLLVQLNWVKGRQYKAIELLRHRLSAWFKGLRF